MCSVFLMARTLIQPEYYTKIPPIHSSVYSLYLNHSTVIVQTSCAVNISFLCVRSVSSSLICKIHNSFHFRIFKGSFSVRKCSAFGGALSVVLSSDELHEAYKKISLRQVSAVWAGVFHEIACV